jgi:hypothetical protein
MNPKGKLSVHGANREILLSMEKQGNGRLAAVFPESLQGQKRGG